jgi:ABC-type uncharacterized transport system substrate-binding protein
VFVASSDPVTLGLVDSINSPGGNITGASPHGFLDEKKLELLGMLLPPTRQSRCSLMPTVRQRHASNIA